VATRHRADGTVPALHPTPPNARPWPDDHEPTEFQAAVVEAVGRLEPGDVVTYGELAQELGRPGSGQAVANVLRSCPDLPWWRVVPGDGRLYRSHAPVQAPLLEAEGHRIDEQRRVHPGGS
jgi:methylated-DNA-protein-cysteine methyltransferase-like protein